MQTHVKETFYLPQKRFSLYKRLDGDEAPEDWQGGIDIIYRIGGSFRYGTHSKKHPHLNFPPK